MGEELGMCDWRYDDGTMCGLPAAIFRQKHWPHARTAWHYCPLHAYQLRAIAVDLAA